MSLILHIERDPPHVTLSMFRQNVLMQPEDHSHNFEVQTNIILDFQTGIATADFE